MALLGHPFVFLKLELVASCCFILCLFVGMLQLQQPRPSFWTFKHRSISKTARGRFGSIRHWAKLATLATSEIGKPIIERHRLFQGPTSISFRTKMLLKILFKKKKKHPMACWVGYSLKDTVQPTPFDEQRLGYAQLRRRWTLPKSGRLPVEQLWTEVVVSSHVQNSMTRLY